jgi:hypothetical protein
MIEKVMTRLFLFVGLTLNFLIVAVGQAQQISAPPVDQAQLNPGFLRFRSALQKAVSEKNEAFLLAHVSDDILLSFGGEGGKQELRETLKNDPTFWDEIEDVLVMGGRFDASGAFVAPYTFVFELPPDYDPFDALFVTGTDVRVRTGPDLTAPVLTKLSHTVVNSAMGNRSGAFLEVVLDTGQRGYIHEDYLRSPIDYRALFRPDGDSWKIGVFVAGD